MSTRPDFHDYFMQIAIAVRERALCQGRHVGAVLVKDERIISTGYNGTPEGFPNCDETDQGCYRCANRGARFQSGRDYDLCICVHVEQNALLAAARFGNAVDGATLYSTLQPCFGCVKEALQAKVRRLYWLNPWTPPGELAENYALLLDRFDDARRATDLVDPLGGKGGLAS